MALFLSSAILSDIGMVTAIRDAATSVGIGFLYIIHQQL